MNEAAALQPPTAAPVANAATGRIRVGMLSGVVLAFVLIGVGLFRTRETLGRFPALGVSAATLVLLAYAATGWFGAPAAARRNSGAFRIGCRAGMGLGVLFAAQVFGEYLLPVTGRADQLIGLAVFGGLLPLAFLVGGYAATTAAGPAAPTLLRRVSSGAVASLWMMVLGSLVWLNCFLAAYLTFWSTGAERRLFDAEGVWADFARSGEADLRAFLITDYLGACFFHLTLGPSVGAAFGAFGAAAVAGFRALVPQRRT